MARGWRPNPMSGRLGRLYKCTPAELSLEDAVAALGVPYRIQFPGYLYGSRFFPDFVLPTLQLVIEVDDDSHNKTDKMLADNDRSESLERKFGWTVVRCSNDEALTDPHGAVRRMLMEQALWPIPEGLRTLRVADFLPKPAKCPPKEKTTRAAPGVERQRRRVKVAKTRAKKRGRVFVLNVNEGEE